MPKVYFFLIFEQMKTAVRESTNTKTFANRHYAI